MGKPNKNCILCHTFPPKDYVELYDEFICNECVNELIIAQREQKSGEPETD